MKVEIHLYKPNASDAQAVITADVPAFWPVPRTNEYITLDFTDHPSILEGEIEVNLAQVYTVNYELNSKLELVRVVLSAEIR